MDSYIYPLIFTMTSLLIYGYGSYRMNKYRRQNKNEYNMLLMYIEQDEESCQKLINYGADVNYITGFGETALLRAINDNNIEKCRVLIKNGADVNLTKTFYRCPPLVMAMLLKHKEIFRLLLENGANTNQQGGASVFSTFWYPLTHACIEEDIESCELLIKYGAKLDTIEHHPLIDAVANNCRIDICRLLIKSGADINVRHFNMTPLAWAARNGNLELCKMLIDEGVFIEDPKASIEACTAGHKNICQFFIDKGMEIDPIGLIKAIVNNHVEIWKLLIDNWIDTSFIATTALEKRLYVPVLEYEELLRRKRDVEKCKKIKEELMAYTWNPERKLGEWLVMNEFNNEFNNEFISMSF